MTKDELLEEAKRRYPVGTKFKSAYKGDWCEVIDLDFEWVEQYKAIQNSNGGWVYQLGNWSEIFEEPKVETKFEKGKWYKNLGINEDYIAKFKKIEKNTQWVCESYIYNNSFHLVNGDLTKSFSNAVECPLEEIQQYLPADHPDKIKQEVEKEVKPVERWSIGSYVVFLKDYGGHSKGTIDIIKNTGKHFITVKNCFFNSGDDECNLYKDTECEWFPTLQEAQKFSDELLGKNKTGLRVEDLVEEEIYYCESCTIEFKQWLYKYLTHNNNPTSSTHAIRIDSGNYYDNNPSTICGANHVKNIRLATPEEKKWLKTCIKQDKFIEQSELNKYDDEGNFMEKNEEYPEYVKLINTGGCIGEAPIINRIYKLVKDNRKNYQYEFLLDNVYKFGFDDRNGKFTKYFEPSTKEAYASQFKKDDKFKNGDWLVYIGDCGSKPSTPIKIGDVRQMIEGRFGSLTIYGIKDLSQYFRRALPHEIPINNSIKEEPKLVFPYKVGDRIRCIKLNTWSSSAYSRSPLNTCNGKVVEITKIRELDTISRHIPFAATYNGVEYGFSYSDGNKYELVESLEDAVIANYMDIFNKIGMLPLTPEECYFKKQEVKNPLDDSEREVNINFSKPKQIKF